MGDLARRAGQKTDHTMNKITEGTGWLQSKREVSLGTVKTKPLVRVSSWHFLLRLFKQGRMWVLLGD